METSATSTQQSQLWQENFEALKFEVSKNQPLLMPNQPFKIFEVVEVFFSCSRGYYQTYADRRSSFNLIEGLIQKFDKTSNIKKIVSALTFKSDFNRCNIHQLKAEKVSK